MGARNAIRVYRGWGRTLKDRPLRLLVYMALISMDGDSEPWFSLGASTHETLAEHALSLRLPDEPKGDASADERAGYDAARDAVLRKVRRHLAPLHAAGAIETKRRAVTTQQGGSAAVYRLYLDGPKLSSPFPSYTPLAGRNREPRTTRARPGDAGFLFARKGGLSGRAHPCSALPGPILPGAPLLPLRGDRDGTLQVSAGQGQSYTRRGSPASARRGLAGDGARDRSNTDL